MARFSKLNDDIVNILFGLIDNQNLCKLLYYNSENPLSQPDIVDTSDLIFKHIFPFPKLIETEDTQNSYLTAHFDLLRLSTTNVGTKEGVIRFNIITHIDLWKIEHMLRPLAILNEIDEIFNNNRIVGIKKMQFDMMRHIWYNKFYCGYQVDYQIVTVN